MSWSLNEIESTARKAARGAGMAWGLAEEAGKATRWLCAAGWPGADCLAAHLSDNDGASWDDIRPEIARNTWEAKGGLLCPLATGASICDLAHDWANGARVELGPTSYPILLIPYIIWAADVTGTAQEIAWQGVRVARGEGETRARISNLEALCAPRADRVAFGQAGFIDAAPIRRVYRAQISSVTARILTKLAQRTYAPETPQSKFAGAGAGLSDND